VGNKYKVKLIDKIEKIKTCVKCDLIMLK
jgi:hypothetical protein